MIVLHVTPTPVAYVDMGKGYRNPRTTVLSVRCADGVTRWWFPRSVVPGLTHGAPIAIQGFDANGAPLALRGATDGYGNVSAWIA